LNWFILFQELETRRGEVASLEEQLARRVQERDDLQQRLEQSLASLKEAEEAERTRVEAERTRVEVERMRDKVEEDLRRQVASLSQKLDSTLQGKNFYV
jgi:F0F1-type ATP synthase membrane subunit b/b'